MTEADEWVLIYVQIALLAVQVALFVSALVVGLWRQNYEAGLGLSLAATIMAAPVCGIGVVVMAT